jgi:diguanylate cyclase (GGDEF)-like protein
MRRFGTSTAAIAVALLVGAGVLAIVLAATGNSLADAWDDGLLLVLAASGLAGLWAWREAGERAANLAGAERETASRLGQQLAKEQARAAALERRHRVEREWIRELRSRVAEYQHQRGVLGGEEDLPALVLRTTMSLLGAEKGLLLSRTDADGDGDLDLLAADGFRSDLADSAIVQRFAEEVIERDKIVRADEASLDSASDADREIESLVAIPIFVRDRFSGVVVAANKPGGFTEDEDEVLLSLGDHAGAVLHNAHLRGELRTSYLATIGMLADAMEAKDPVLGGHSDEISTYVSAVAKRLGLEPRRREELVFASLLHDVGKIGISERILLKPAALTAEERAVMELHPRIGYRLVQHVPSLHVISMAVLHHHERYDGDGYPSRLRGEEIPIEARIVAIADAFSAMTSDRPYRERRSSEDACAELERCAGTQFDSEIVRLFVEEVRRRPLRQDRHRPSSTDTDPELEVILAADEPVLGFGQFAATDNLTLLYAHRYFHELASAEAERAGLQGSPFAVLLARLVELEAVNREQGYAAGDELIRLAARAVQRAAADCGGSGCRVSGSCLGIVVRGADERDADECRRRLEEHLGDSVSAQIAHAVWRPGESGEDVVDRARRELSAITA